MRAPLDNMTVTNPFGQSGYGVFGKHAGVDLRASIGTPVYAPADGVITENYTGTDGIIVLGVRIGSYDHRFLHLSKTVRKTGNVKEGELIAYSGNTGNVVAHLHWDVRKAGTAWNHAFSDYVDPLSLIKGGSMGDFSKEAEDRQQALIAIAKEVSVDYKDLSNVVSVVTNIRSLGARIDELGKIVSIQEKEIASLKSQVGDNSKWETLKALLRELLGIK